MKAQGKSFILLKTEFQNTSRTQQRTDPPKILLHVIRSKNENGATSTSGCSTWKMMLVFHWNDGPFSEDRFLWGCTNFLGIQWKKTEDICGKNRSNNTCKTTRTTMTTTTATTTTTTTNNNNNNNNSNSNSNSNSNNNNNKIKTKTTKRTKRRRRRRTRRKWGSRGSLGL